MSDSLADLAAKERGLARAVADLPRSELQTQPLRLHFSVCPRANHAAAAAALQPQPAGQIRSARPLSCADCAAGGCPAQGGSLNHRGASVGRAGQPLGASCSAGAHAAPRPDGRDEDWRAHQGGDCCRPGGSVGHRCTMLCHCCHGYETVAISVPCRRHGWRDHLGKRRTLPHPRRRRPAARLPF